MRVMANSHIAAGVDPEQLTRFFDENGIASSTWDLVRHRVISQYSLKVGDIPGVVLFMDVGSIDEAAELVSAFPAVENGLLTFEIEPLGISI